VLDEARLAAPRRAFEHDGQARGLRRFEQLDLATDGEVERLVRDDVLFDCSFRHKFKVRKFKVQSSRPKHLTLNLQLGTLNYHDGLKFRRDSGILLRAKKQ
jgi:hypothetical protein